MPRRLVPVASVLVVALAAATGCSEPVGSTAGAARGTAVTVFAAASMRTTFTALGASFESTRPGVTVSFNFAGSQALAEQLTQGAPADVFASANDATMATVTAAGLGATVPKPYATNQLQIAVPPGNPARVATFADLARPGTKLVTCAPAVPCGAVAAKVARAAGVTLRPVSEEQAVTDVLAKVESGEADAGLVYRTDVLAAKGRVLGIAFPESATATNNNSIVALRTGPQAALGQEFVDLVLSADGQRVLTDAGFGTAG